MCHGADGKGTKDGPQILNPVAGYATYVVRHGRNEMGFPAPMMAFDTAALTDPEVAAILGFLAKAEKPTTGPELYGRFCQNCHGETGRAGRVGKNIVREVNNMASIVRQVTAARATAAARATCRSGRRPRSPMPSSH